jgi:hypothetical protein
MVDFRSLNVKKEGIMIRRLVIFLVLGLILSSSLAQAQYGRTKSSYGRSDHKFEITPFGGFSWTNSYDIYYGHTSGSLDLNDGPIYGVIIDINMIKPGAQLELSYSWQEEKLTYDQGSLFGKRDLFDMSVEYFQIGGVYGIQQGDVLPFSSLTLGATRWNPQNIPGVDDVWKFSVILSLGAKVYMNERMGLRLQFRLPMTMIESGAGMFCGPGGCYTAVSATGVLQAEVSAGLMILL